MGHPAPSPGRPKSRALKVSPAHSERGLLKRDAGTPGPVGGALTRTGRGQNSSLKTSGAADPRSGTRRRLRGEAARLAQRRGRGPGGPQSAPRNPRGNVGVGK